MGRKNRRNPFTTSLRTTNRICTIDKRRPKPTTDELMAVLPGPDFPSGGIVVDEHLRTKDPAIWAVGDAIAVLDHLGIEKAHIVGLSMGGFCALHFGLNHPGRALSLEGTVAGAAACADTHATVMHVVCIKGRLRHTKEYKGGRVSEEVKKAAKDAPMEVVLLTHDAGEMHQDRDLAEILRRVASELDPGAAASPHGAVEPARDAAGKPCVLGTCVSDAPGGQKGLAGLVLACAVYIGHIL